MIDATPYARGQAAYRAARAAYDAALDVPDYATQAAAGVEFNAAHAALSAEERVGWDAEQSASTGLFARARRRDAFRGGCYEPDRHGPLTEPAGGRPLAA